MAADLLYYTGAVGAAAALYTALLATCSSAALRRDLQECLGRPGWRGAWVGRGGGGVARGEECSLSGD